MKAFLILIIAKLALFFGNLMGRGSSFPGKVAQRMDEDILSRFTFPEKMILITGTNGKTTTANYVAKIIEESGMKVMHNAKGANLEWGIITQAIAYSDLSYHIAQDVAVLEVDEGTFPKIVDVLNPQYVAILNLFPDQEDRFGGAGAVAKLLSNAIPEGTQLILNGNDPRLVNIGLDNQDNHPLYFGLAPLENDQPFEVIECPRCSETLHVDFPFYEHIAYFHCENCELQTPEIDFLAEEVDLEEATMKVNADTYSLAHLNMYSAFNAVATVAISQIAGAEEEAIASVLKHGLNIKGRSDYVEYKGQYLNFNLAKNIAGFNQSISKVLSEVDDTYDIVISINNNRADGISYTWISDVAFHRLDTEKLNKVYLTGLVKEDLYDVFIKQGFDEKQVTTESNEHALNLLVGSNHQKFVISNYTAMNDLYKILKD